MNNKFIITITLLFLITASMVSCVQKLPKQPSNNEGVLLIAHKASNKSEVNAWTYRYRLNYSPKTKVDIRINPGGNRFYIFSHFPSGKYKLESITIIGMDSTLSVAKTISKTYPITKDLHFEIKPNHITLLDHSFNVYKKNQGYNETIEGPKFERIDVDQLIDIQNELSKIEGINSWNLSEKLEYEIKEYDYPDGSANNAQNNHPPDYILLYQDGVYSKYGSGIIFDSSTNLEWLVGPDKTLSWEQADHYVSNHSVEGGNWRLPTIAELKSLYNKDLEPMRRNSLFHSNRWGVWSSERREEKIGESVVYFPLYFDFHGGEPKWTNGRVGYNGMVFMVRYRK